MRVNADYSAMPLQKMPNFVNVEIEAACLYIGGQQVVRIDPRQEFILAIGDMWTTRIGDCKGTPSSIHSEVLDS